jgi:homoserine O-acetyltransferase
LKHPPLLASHVDAPHHAADLGDLVLESGEVIHDFRQTYVTHGALDAAKSNAVLVLPAITSTHHRLDFLVGPGRALDPARWFVIAVDTIGNGLATSPSNSSRQPRMKFPRFTLRDMVAAQHRLLTERLALPRVHAIVGASMGGMQALQWAVSHPLFAAKIVAMTPMARASAWSIAANEATRSCLYADPGWNGSEFTARPERGWKAWVAVQQALVARTPQALAHDFPDPPAVLGWVAERQRTWLDAGFDAHDFLYQSWAYDRHDVGTTPGFGGDWKRALASIRAQVLVLTAPLDLYNPAESGQEAALAIPGATHEVIPSIEGHQSANVTRDEDVAFVNQAVGAFL